MDMGCIYVKTLEIMCMSRNINLRIQFKPSSSPSLDSESVSHSDVPDSLRPHGL